MLPLGDIMINMIVVVVGYLSLRMVSLGWIRRKKDDTEYTKDIKLNRNKKILLVVPFGYKHDKIEMEFVVIQMLNYIWTVIFVITSLFIKI